VDNPTRPVQEGQTTKWIRRSKQMMTGTAAVLAVLVASGISGVITRPETSPIVFKLWVAALVVAGIQGVVFLAINWETIQITMGPLFLAQVLALIGFIICVGLGAYFLAFGEPEPGDPAKMSPTLSASGQADAHQDCAGTWFHYEPEKAMDDQDDTAWRVPGDGRGSWIMLNYTRPVKVNTIGIIPGHDKIDKVCGIDRFFSLHVVRQVSIEFSDGTVEPKQFDRNRSMQWLPLDSPKRTESVRITIKDTYPLKGDDTFNETAISEIEVR
jgi:hypothetical protein